MTPSSSCPICTEPVPPNATECPNCGAALTVEPSPAFVVEEAAKGVEIREEAGEAEKPEAAETPMEAEPPHVKAGRVKKSAREKVVKQKSEPQRERVEILSHGFPFDPSLPFICPNCGFGFDEPEQEVCPACQSAIAKEKATSEKEIHQTRVENFVEPFDREEGLEDPVLAYLYRKHVKPALMERYEPVTKKWADLFAQGSIAIPGRNVDTKPNPDRILDGSRAAMQMARLWVSPAVIHYAVASEARREINEYMRDLLCRAYQVLGQYHSWRGAQGGNYRDMEAAYQQSQLMIRKAAELQSKLSPETQSLNQSAAELLRMALSYPEKYQKVGKGKNPIIAEGAPGYEQDKQAYEEYLTAYSSLEMRVEDCREHLDLVHSSFEENIRNLEKRVEELEEEKQRKSKEAEKEAEEIKRKYALAVRVLPERKASAQAWAFWTPAIIGLVSVIALSLSELPGNTVFGVGLGAMALSYFHGFSKETFHGQALPGVQIIKWVGFFLLLWGLFPMFEEWLSIAF